MDGDSLKKKTSSVKSGDFDQLNLLWKRRIGRRTNKLEILFRTELMTGTESVADLGGGPQGPGPPLTKIFKKIKKLNLMKIELSRFEDSILQQLLTEERRFNILLVVNSLVNISCTY